MGIDANIALGIKTPQVASPLDQYANMLALTNAQRQGQLGDIQVQNALRAQRDEQEDRQTIMGAGGNQDAAINALLSRGRYGPASAIAKSRDDQAKAKVDLDKAKADTLAKNLEIYGNSMATLLGNPSADNVSAVLGNLKASGIPLHAPVPSVLSQDALMQWVRSGAAASKHGLDAIHAYLPKIEMTNLGGTVQPTNLNSLAGSIGATGNALKKTPTFAEIETQRHNPVMEGIAQGNLGVARGNLGVAQGNLSVARKRLDNEADPALQGRLAGARTAAQERAKEDVDREYDPIRAADAARKILKAVNYDSKKKTDDIAKLIDKSTSGLLQNAVAQGYGAVTGDATTGRQAIGQLVTEANKLTTDLMGGKLGSGISNADRDFILGQLGDVGNANTPAPERRAAWNKAISRLNAVAGGSAPTKAPAAPKPAQPTNPHANKSDAEILKELGVPGG